MLEAPLGKSQQLDLCICEIATWKKGIAYECITFYVYVVGLNCQKPYYNAGFC